MCSLKLRHESSHTPRYQIDLAGFTFFISPGVLVGMVMGGPSPECLPLFNFVKCMSSFFTWSILRPLVESHLWASQKVTSTILVVSCLFCAEAAIDPSSMYRVRGDRLLCFRSEK